MRTACLLALLGAASWCWAADLESRVLTTYVPQDTLESVVRLEDWTELKLDVKGGVRKGDTVRVWIGGMIDRGNGDRPGQNVNGPSGIEATGAVDVKALALSPQPEHAMAVLFKTESPGMHRPGAPRPWPDRAPPPVAAVPVLATPRAARPVIAPRPPRHEHRPARGQQLTSGLKSANMPAGFSAQIHAWVM